MAWDLSVKVALQERGVSKCSPDSDCVLGCSIDKHNSLVTELAKRCNISIIKQIDIEVSPRWRLRILNLVKAVLVKLFNMCQQIRWV